MPSTIGIELAGCKHTILQNIAKMVIALALERRYMLCLMIMAGPYIDFLALNINKLHKKITLFVTTLTFFRR
ncbi:MAG: hypothetical protein CMM83_03805 [Rhodospirillales bacterium]|nr:hypothetical protein [Rhodospirillales bacterium]